LAKTTSRNTSIPTGRVRRTAEIGGLVGGQAVRAYATKAANLTRSVDASRVAAEQRQIKAAEQIVDVLGHIKGLAMKVGQVASFIDSRVCPRTRGTAFRGSSRRSATRRPASTSSNCAG
jgi:predicted unusual protein kinase regulating ubiquinone biosynthesis (AarF/ABC1/UbiB family)